MSQLSPKAMRFVEIALQRQGDERQQADWQSWNLRRQDDEMPSHIAQIALHALSGLALAFEARIDSADTDAMTAAQLENDLGYIAEIEKALSNHLWEPARSFA
jgi:hypothetical protein